MKKNLAALCLWTMACVAGNAATLKELRVENLRAPLGVDTATPHFSWQLESGTRGCRQTSYHIIVRDASGAEVWNSGNVTGAEQYGVAYSGSPLAANAAYTWTLRVQTTDGEAEASSAFETAFMDASQWKAKWIGEGEGEKYSKYEIKFETPVRARYLRLNVTALGHRASTDAGYSFVQLDEVEVYAGTENVALSAGVSASNTWSLPQYGWDLSFVNDGKIKDAGRNGWTTQQNPATPVTLVLDLKEEKDVDRIVLYPRQNDHAVGDVTKAANFPASFTVDAKLNTGAYAEKYRVINEDAPIIPTAGKRVPLMARNFSVSGKVKRARIYASALGVMTMKLNGQRVTDAVLEPGESEYEKTILYSTYDVTNLLKEGKNTLLAEVAGGIYNIDYLAGRFSKGEVTNNGTPALIAELLIEYTDGATERLVTDETWRWKSGPTLGSNWWGGEDYDARLQIPGIGDADADLSQWEPVHIVTPHFQSPHSGVSGHGVLRSRMYEPLRVVEEWPAVSVKTVSSGGYTLRMVDFGRNFAGQYRFRLKGRAGQKISLRCGESLNPDGSVYMENFYTGPADTYEEYTFRGDEAGEEWGPEFMYHGFRYLQIIGLDEEPDAAAFTAMRIRSAMENVGTVVTSNALVNDIHVICRDAIASQLYNSITDCPHREKLGWLDVPNEMYVSLSSNFNMQNFYKKVVMDCFDAQQSDGWVPSVAPFYMNVYGDDPNWGGAAILVPYRNWRYYGDKSLMEKHYPQMKLLMSHYAENTSGYLINNAFSVLSDWGQETAGVSPMVPTEFTETTTYYYLAASMAEMAAELGYDADATAYSDLAANIRRAFNNKFYDAATGVYTSINGGGGRQSEQAMPLYYGLVPEGDGEKVCAVLADRVRQDGYKIKTGEIALKCVFMSLARYGYDDIVWQMANQTDCPSYGYWVREGYTTTPEYWDVGAFSRNHCMMDHIEEWFFTRLGGIQNTGMAFSTLRIAPFVPQDLQSCDVATDTTFGLVRSSWNRDGEKLLCRFDVPFGATATIVVPCDKTKHLAEGGEPLTGESAGVISVTYGDGKATVVCGGGSYLWEVADGESPTAVKVGCTVPEDGILYPIYDIFGRYYGTTSDVTHLDSATNPMLHPNKIYIVNRQKKLVK